MALRFRLHPATKVKGDRFLSQPRSPGSRCQSFRPGWGQLRSQSPLPPARRALFQTPRRLRTPSPGPHSPRVDMAQAATAKQEVEEKPAGRGEERIPRRAHGLARPASPGRAHASRRTPARLAGWGSRAGSRGSAGRGAADSQGRLGGAGSPAPSPRAGLTRVQRLLGMHCPLGHGAGQSFVPEQGGACDGVYVGYSLDQCL